MMDYETGMDIIRTAVLERDKERLYFRWVTGFQMSMDFAEFLQKAGYREKQEEIPSGSDETVEEILKKVKGIIDGDF